MVRAEGEIPIVRLVEITKVRGLTVLDKVNPSTQTGRVCQLSVSYKRFAKRELKEDEH